MRQYLQTIFGTYNTLIDPSTGEIVQGISGVDWEYLVGAIIFVISLWFVYKALLSLLGYANKH